MYLIPALPELLLQTLLLFALSPVEFQYSLVMIVYRNAQDLLWPLLSDHELIEMVFEGPWGEPWSSDDGGISQWSTSWLSWFVASFEGLIGKVGALELRGR